MIESNPNGEAGAIGSLETAPSLLQAVRLAVILLAVALISGVVAAISLSVVFPKTTTIAVFAASVSSAVVEIIIVVSFTANGCRYQAPGLLVRDTLRGFYLGSLAVLLTLWALGMLLVFMLLLFFHAELGAYLGATEAGVLVLTLIAIVFLSRYTARSFSADVSVMLVENRESGKALRDSYAASSRELAGSFDKNTEKLVQMMESQEKDRQAVLTDLATATRQLAETLKEEQRRMQDLSERQIRAQKEAEERRRQDEAAREAERREREEEERIRLMPRLGLQMYSEGMFFHRLHLRIINFGMEGRNVRVSLDYSSRRRMPLRASAISSQGTIDWSLGDVAGFGLQEDFTVTCTVSDIQGRDYACHGRFQYRRSTGFLGRTKGIQFQPSGFQYPKVEPADARTMPP